MNDKKFPAAGKKKNSLTALALIVCMLLTLAVQGIGSAKAVDLDQGCALTVSPGTYEDLVNAEVVIDLYKVADAAPVQGYDTYRFTPTGAYAGMDSIRALEDMTTVDQDSYQAIAQEAAALTLTTEGISIAKTVDGKEAGASISELENGQKLSSGLYLLIARGKELEEPADYVTSVTAEGETSSRLATVAYSDEYTYTFRPELIALPSRMVLGNDGTVESNETSNTVDWQYDLAVTLKPEQALRFGNLMITKNLPDYAAGEPASFIFQVEAYQDETRAKSLYSNVAAITFSDPGSQTLRIEGVIPVGAYVEVTEVYSGISYRLQDGESVRTTEIPAPEDGAAARVEFTNLYQGAATHGGAVTNHFEYNAEDSDWNWVQE